MSELALQLIAANKKTKSPILDLGKCGLTQVPEAIGELVWLETLILSDFWNEYDFGKKDWKQKNSQNRGGTNKIGWANCQNLRSLDISKSKVENIAPLKSLIEKGLQVTWDFLAFGICVQDCPLVHPPVEIVKQGNTAILQYFEEIERARKTNSVIRLAEAKCLILGEGGAGKTSLTRKLLNPKNPLPEEKETTKGIAVHPHDLSLADGTAFRLNIWDFGGQEIYHATHQFFLTKRSLYILLDDTRKDEKTVHDPIFNYWL